MSSDIIQLLPDHVANQIAAGEVVQRPASVVKELLENAIDAQADKITLLIKEAGKTLIQVADNGIGMSETDARLSFERHATSKISTAQDLFHLQTKGFRGEALASIAAIAQVSLKTKRAQDEIGTEIEIKGNRVELQEPCVTPTGTIVAVKNLFYNIPARRKFLKSDRVELRHIIDEFQRVALAHPQIAFTFYHNDSELFNLFKSNQRQRIVSVFGTKMNEKLVPIKEETDLVKISGYIGKPEFAKRTKGEQFFFVNQRFVKSGYLHHALKSTYEGLIQEQQQPTYFLFLAVDPESIDINIHPTKTEVKFDDEHAIYSILSSAVRHSLGQFNVAPTLDFKHKSEFDTPYAYKDKPAQIPKIEIDRNFNPFQEEKKSTESQRKTIYLSSKNKRLEWEGLYTGLDSEEDDDFSSVEIESEVNTATLFGQEATEERRSEGVFQLHNKYIISPLKESILVIHQNRAHYRILFEEFLKNITLTRAVSQQLLFPLKLQLTRPHMELLKRIIPNLEQTGFDFGELTEEEVQIVGIPTGMAEKDVTLIVDRMLADLEANRPEENANYTSYIADFLAKKMAIKTGVLLTFEEQIAIIDKLFACKEPAFSPENKKVFIRLNTEDLDKIFK